MEKSKVRQQMQARRLAMTEEEVKRKSEAICRKVVETDAFQKADIVCIYIPIHNEVDLRELLSICRKLSKRVAVPRIRKGQMEFAFISNLDDLIPGRFGILEPAGDETISAPALILMPGVAFDQSCHRIGHGGGFYDRYLAEHPEAETMAVAYDWQILENVPFEPFDIRPQMVVTESRIMQQEKL